MSGTDGSAGGRRCRDSLATTQGGELPVARGLCPRGILRPAAVAKPLAGSAFRAPSPRFEARVLGVSVEIAKSRWWSTQDGHDARQGAGALAGVLRAPVALHPAPRVPGDRAPDAGRATPARGRARGAPRA